MTPKLPSIDLELLEDLSPRGQTGFLTLLRQRYQARYADGTTSPAFEYDQVERRALDAVVIAPHFVDASGVRHVYLRSALRPPLLSRVKRELAETERHPRAGLWELPAGLVEPTECTPEGLFLCAQRELDEEVGFQVEVDSLMRLGQSTLPCPGVIAERHYYFDVEVRPNAQREPGLDGSPLECGGLLWAANLDEVLELCRLGDIDDSKTELGLRRLREKYP